MSDTTGPDQPVCVTCGTPIVAALAGRTPVELPAGVDGGQGDHRRYFASPDEDDISVELDIDDEPLITDGIRLFDADGAEQHGTVLIAAARHGRRLAAESSGDGESRKELCTLNECKAAPRCSSGATVWHDKTAECGLYEFPGDGESR